MRPEQKSQLLLGVTRSKAKMLEYGVPAEHHIKIAQDPAKLFTLSIGLLGDLAASINREISRPEALSDLRNNLLFSAHFFDSYLQTKLNESLDPYLILLGSASYYLCDLPGSASVLAKRIKDGCPNLGGEGLECLLLWLLKADLSDLDGCEGPFGYYIDGISQWVLQFFEDGTGEDNLLDLATKLRATVYKTGSPRQLLFGDVIAAVLRRKLQNSSWNALPLYSGLPKDKWLNALQKESFIKELWPAQHLLGQADVLQGKSAIVQMPTSAGKTKATELVLRSAFLGERTSLAIIVAPFRALCHEIKNSLVAAFHNEPTRVDELSDALQTDFEIAELLGHQQILVVTPEKLLYVLRHAPELASYVGLLVFDEGHQFDSGTRGITYELLLTSLNSMLPEGVQKVLISAVISNAKAVGEWLIGDPNVVEGINLNPTYRSVGFASWLDQLGRIEYVDSRNAEQAEFFVPRVIERLNLVRKPRESSDRFFPEQALNTNGKPNPDYGKTVALYLGLKLFENGSIAIFCGKPETASSICKKAVEYYERGLSLSLPSNLSDQRELERLKYLHIANLGADDTTTKSASLGIFSHHGNTPHGIRLAVEHAMRENHARFVICTSTLAQGVNLPIRYLIVTGFYQGEERIKVRDFHNLIGRAGRSGMHTEGSVLFADPSLYDKRYNSGKDKWRWKQVKELLDPVNSEPCISNLLSIFEPFKSDDEKYNIRMKALDFAKAYINDPDEIAQLAAGIAEQHVDKGFSLNGVERQVAWRISLICAVESFLLSHWDETEDGLSDADVIHLAEGTLAFFLADDQKKEHIRELFQLLAENISANISSPARRRIYGRTLYGVQDAQAIERWFQSNAASLLSNVDETEFLDLIWPLLTCHIKGGIFSKFDKPEVLKEVTQMWIEGKPYHEILGAIQERGAKMIWGTRMREFKINHVVDICEGGLAYDGALLISAVIEFVDLFKQEDANDLRTRLQTFQKQLKYGLPTEAAIILYELGFSDRVVAQDLALELNLSNSHKRHIVRAMKKNGSTAFAVIYKYPSYFHKRLAEICN